MGLRDSFSFREKPTGLFKWILKAPAYLYKARLGFVFGERFILITHVGRKSGREFNTPVEVVVHDTERGEYIVCSGTGSRADWYRNLHAAPAVRVQVRNDRWVPAQRFLDDGEAARTFRSYEDQHPKTAAKLLDSMGRSYDGTDEGRLAMMADMPMVAFSDGPRADGPS